MDAHHEDPTFGYRYLADEARRAGWRMSRRTAWKLCSQAGILSSAQRRRRGKGKKAGPPASDDHVQQVFRADAPNRLWLTDITEHWTSEGKLYCCAIKDVFSNRIVGYSISDRMTAKLAVDAVRNAVARRGEVAGCILHADRGSQFRSRAMARELRRHDMVGSMGRVGAAGDNAAMESFWSLRQTNVLNQQRWATRPSDAARCAGGAGGRLAPVSSRGRWPRVRPVPPSCALLLAVVSQQPGAGGWISGKAAFTTVPLRAD